MHGCELLVNLIGIVYRELPMAVQEPCLPTGRPAKTSTMSFRYRISCGTPSSPSVQSREQLYKIVTCSTYSREATISIMLSYDYCGDIQMLYPGLGTLEEGVRKSFVTRTLKVYPGNHKIPG